MKKIELIPLVEFKPTKEGKYLVKTCSSGLLAGFNFPSNYNYLTVRVNLYKGAYSIDIHNQKVLLISKEPII